MSSDVCVALPRGAMGLSAFCDCGISYPDSFTIFDLDCGMLHHLIKACIYNTHAYNVTVLF